MSSLFYYNKRVQVIKDSCVKSRVNDVKELQINFWCHIVLSNKSHAVISAYYSEGNGDIACDEYHKYKVEHFLCQSTLL